MVVKVRLSAEVMVAEFASRAETATQSGAAPSRAADAGEGITRHVAPSVVRRIAPSLPTIQQTVPEGAEPASK